VAAIDKDVFGDRWTVAERSARAAWVQIEEQLADRIESGLIEPGTRLPPERELARASWW
jgi:DNA-binding GntR family transcriptional regulator